MTVAVDMRFATCFYGARSQRFRCVFDNPEVTMVKETDQRKETTFNVTGSSIANGSFATMSAVDRLEFERLLLYLRLCFLLAPLLLIAAYGLPAIAPSVEVELAILADCAVVWSLLHWFPERSLRAQLALRSLDLAVTYIALHFVHLFLANAYYDSVYLLFVVAATATHGRRGTYMVAGASALAVLAGRLQLIWAGVFPFQVRHVSDTFFYALLFLTTGATTEFLMKKSAQAVAIREREASEAIKASEERYRGLFENATDIVYEHDLQGNFTTFNRAGQDRLGYSLADLPGLTIADVVDPGDLDRVRAMIGAKIDQDGGTTYELVLRAKDGRRVQAEVSSQLLVKGGVPVAVQGIARDITERKSLEHRLRHEAMHDSLTGLPNRVLFQDRLHAAVANARRASHTVAVLLLDLDRFKPINDIFGHSSGDEMLRHLADALAGVLRDADTVARIGGDEFAVLLIDSDGSGASLVAEKLLHVISTPCVIDGHALAVGASIGIALYPQDSIDVEVLLQLADAAMYDAKRSESGYQLYRGHAASETVLAGIPVTFPAN
jgi:diguanylate cyclase (GGDEF)-like protein/PAS domain S-box-containing protein